MSGQSKPSIVFCHGLVIRALSRLPMLSQLALVLDVIRTAAGAVQGSAAAVA